MTTHLHDKGGGPVSVKHENVRNWFVIQYVENITRWRENHAIYSRMCKTGSEGQVWGNTIIHPDALMHA